MDKINKFLSERGIRIEMKGAAFHDYYEPWDSRHVFEYRITAKRGGHEFVMPWFRGCGLEIMDWGKPWKPRWDTCREALAKARMSMSERDREKLGDGKVVWWGDPAVERMVALSLKCPPANEAAEAFIQCAADCFNALEHKFEDWGADFGYGADSLKAYRIHEGLKDDAAKLLQGGFVGFEDARAVIDMAAEL